MPIAEAASTFEARAAALEARLTAEVTKELPREVNAINSAILRAERLRKRRRHPRPGHVFKSLLAASDEDSGYASWPLPALRYCVDAKDDAIIVSQVGRYLAVHRTNLALDEIEADPTLKLRNDLPPFAGINAVIALAVVAAVSEPKGPADTQRRSGSR